MNIKEAIFDFNKAIELNPKFVGAYINRGSVKNELHEFREAIQDLNKAIELNHNSTEAFNNRGIAKIALG